MFYIERENGGVVRYGTGTAVLLCCSTSGATCSCTYTTVHSTTTHHASHPSSVGDHNFYCHFSFFDILFFHNSDFGLQ